MHENHGMGVNAEPNETDSSQFPACTASQNPTFVHYLKLNKDPKHSILNFNFHNNIPHYRMRAFTRHPFPK